jgi:hypothetical protein
VKNVVKTSLRQPPVQGHLSALKTGADAGTRAGQLSIAAPC